MNRILRLVLVCLLSAVVVLSSCTQNAPEVPLKAEKETAKPASPTPPQTTEPKPASFSVSGLTITPEEVTSGSSVTIEVLVTNTGELPGTYDVTLKIDDTVESTEKVTLEGGASQKVTFTSTKFTAKTYSVGINVQSGTFVVKVAPPSPVVQPPPPPPPPLPPLDAFKKGITFSDWGWAPFDKPRPPMYGPLYNPALADGGLKSLAATGANWVMLIVTSVQETVASTNITRNQYATASDQALLHMIDLAHSLGMRVMLRPQVRLSNDPNHSWIQIGTAFSSEAQWQEWFASYGESINYYAAFAQDAGVDMLVIGDELSSTTHRESDWRRIVAGVRERFKGPITYSSIGSLPSAPLPLGDEKRIMWWDAVDYIGADVYIPLTNKNDPTVEEMKRAWIDKGYLTLLENLSSRFNKPVIFTEVGYQSRDEANKNPGNFNFWLEAPVDLQEQADCYQATLEVLWGKPWLAGMFWWQVSAVGLTWAESPLGKPAEEVLKKFYLSQ